MILEYFVIKESFSKIIISGFSKYKLWVLLKRFVNLLISSYEKFFSHLNSYNFSDFKKKANLMALD